jgi:hypothetical protein
MSLPRDEELVSVIAGKGSKWIFAGLESVDAENFHSVRMKFWPNSEQ